MAEKIVDWGIKHWFLQTNVSHTPSGCKMDLNLGYIIPKVQNICCGNSKESSHWDGSFEHPKLILKLIAKKNSHFYTQKFCLSHPMNINSSFYVFHLDFRWCFLLISMLAKCDRDESCTGRIAPISPKGLKFVAQTDFCVRRWRFCDKRNSAKISKSFISE